MSFKIKLPRNYLTILNHGSLWLVFLGIPVIFEPIDPVSAGGLSAPPIEIRHWVGVCMNLGLVVFFYFNYAWMIPRYYLKGKTLHYFIGIFCTYIIYQFCIVIMRNIAISYLPFTTDTSLIIRLSHVLSTGFFMLMWAASSGFRLGEEWKRTENSRREADSRRISSELALLKSQINPHFLLNSLNNLYALALTTPEKTPDAILKLSEMVAYILYECTKPKIALDRDLHFIENYIALQRLRLASNTTLTLEMPKDIPQKEIEPMILISYIENAFKHGLTTTQPCEIFISIQIDENRLFMRVENQVLTDIAVQKDTQSGIGLENTKQRLAHSYPEKHHLSIQNDGKKHIVELEIEL